MFVAHSIRSDGPLMATTYRQCRQRTEPHTTRCAERRLPREVRTPAPAHPRRKLSSAGAVPDERTRLHATWFGRSRSRIVGRGHRTDQHTAKRRRHLWCIGPTNSASRARHEPNWRWIVLSPTIGQRAQAESARRASSRTLAFGSECIIVARRPTTELSSSPDHAGLQVVQHKACAALRRTRGTGSSSIGTTASIARSSEQ